MKRKIFLISYDDGVYEDYKFVKLLNKYKLKGTFNLNSGLFGTTNRIPKNEIKELYKGHEIAIHTVSHPSLPDLTKQEIINEVIKDKNDLEEISGYEIFGMAYPFGTYNDTVIDVLCEKGILYSRTVNDTHNFIEQTNFLTFHPTCHHNDESIFELLDQFISLESNTTQVFTLWGHTYEFKTKEDWARIESILQKVAIEPSVSSITMSKYVNNRKG